MQIFIDKEIKHIFADKPQQHAFKELMILPGDIIRERPGRRTKQINIDGQQYFIKQLSALSWGKIFKFLLSFRLPDLTTTKEWHALQKLQTCDIDVPRVIAYGRRRSLNVAKHQSFIMTQSLAAHTMSLTDYCKTWLLHPPPLVERHAITKKVAHMTKVLHTNGMVHQDLFFHHFLLDISKPTITDDNIKIYLIDFHRTRIRKKQGNRWIAKDLAGLYCSARNARARRSDLLRFLKHYFALPLRTILQQHRNLLQEVVKRGEATYRRERKKNTNVDLNVLVANITAINLVPVLTPTLLVLLFNLYKQVSHQVKM